MAQYHQGLGERSTAGSGQGMADDRFDRTDGDWLAVRAMGAKKLFSEASSVASPAVYRCRGSRCNPHRVGQGRDRHVGRPSTGPVCQVQTPSLRRRRRTCPRRAARPGTPLRRQGLGERFDQKGHGTFAWHDAVGVLAERFHAGAGGKSRQLREPQEQRRWQHGVEGHDDRVVRLATVDQRLGHIQGIGNELHAVSTDNAGPPKAKAAASSATCSPGVKPAGASVFPETPVTK